MKSPRAACSSPVRTLGFSSLESIGGTLSGENISATSQSSMGLNFELLHIGKTTNSNSSNANPQQSPQSTLTPRGQLVESPDMRLLLRVYQEREIHIQQLLQINFIQPSDANILELAERFAVIQKEEKLRFDKEELVLKKYFNVRADASCLKPAVIELVNCILRINQRSYDELISQPDMQQEALELLKITDKFRHEVTPYLFQLSFRLTSSLLFITAFSRNRFAAQLDLTKRTQPQIIKGINEFYNQKTMNRYQLKNNTLNYTSNIAASNKQSKQSPQLQQQIVYSTDKNRPSFHLQFESSQLPTKKPKESLFVHDQDQYINNLAVPSNNHTTPMGSQLLTNPNISQRKIRVVSANPMSSKARQKNIQTPTKETLTKSYTQFGNQNNALNVHLPAQSVDVMSRQDSKNNEQAKQFQLLQELQVSAQAFPPTIKNIPRKIKTANSSGRRPYSSLKKRPGEAKISFRNHTPNFQNHETKDYDLEMTKYDVKLSEETKEFLAGGSAVLTAFAKQESRELTAMASWSMLKYQMKKHSSSEKNEFLHELGVAFRPKEMLEYNKKNIKHKNLKIINLRNKKIDALGGRQNELSGNSIEETFYHMIAHYEIVNTSTDQLDVKISVQKMFAALQKSNLRIKQTISNHRNTASLNSNIKICQGSSACSNPLSERKQMLKKTSENNIEEDNLQQEDKKLIECEMNDLGHDGKNEKTSNLTGQEYKKMICLTDPMSPRLSTGKDAPKYSANEQESSRTVYLSEIQDFIAKSKIINSSKKREAQDTNNPNENHPLKKKGSITSNKYAGEDQGDMTPSQLSTTKFAVASRPAGSKISSYNSYNAASNAAYCTPRNDSNFTSLKMLQNVRSSSSLKNNNNNNINNNPSSSSSSSSNRKFSFTNITPLSSSAVFYAINSTKNTHNSRNKLFQNQFNLLASQTSTQQNQLCSPQHQRDQNGFSPYVSQVKKANNDRNLFTTNSSLEEPDTQKRDKQIKQHASPGIMNQLPFKVKLGDLSFQPIILSDLLKTKNGGGQNRFAQFKRRQPSLTSDQEQQQLKQQHCSAGFNDMSPLNHLESKLGGCSHTESSPERIQKSTNQSERYKQRNDSIGSSSSKNNNNILAGLLSSPVSPQADKQWKGDLQFQSQGQQWHNHHRKQSLLSDPDSSQHQQLQKGGLLSSFVVHKKNNREKITKNYEGEAGGTSTLGIAQG